MYRDIHCRAHGSFADTDPQPRPLRAQQQDQRSKTSASNPVRARGHRRSCRNHSATSNRGDSPDSVDHAPLRPVSSRHQGLAQIVPRTVIVAPRHRASDALAPRMSTGTDAIPRVPECSDRFGTAHVPLQLYARKLSTSSRACRRVLRRCAWTPRKRTRNGWDPQCLRQAAIPLAAAKAHQIGRHPYTVGPKFGGIGCGHGPLPPFLPLIARLASGHWDI